MLYDITAKAGKETIKAQATGRSPKGALRVFVLSEAGKDVFRPDAEDELHITVTRAAMTAVTGLVSIERVKRPRKPRKAGKADANTPAE